MGSLYDADFAAWSAEQAGAIRDAGRRGVFDTLDWENVAEEIESLGRAERRRLSDAIDTVIEHLLNIEVSPQTASIRLWREKICRTRFDILEDSPSLKRDLANMIADEIASTRALVRDIMVIHDQTPLQSLETITYNEAQVLGDWLPDRAPPPA